MKTKLTLWMVALLLLACNQNPSTKKAINEATGLGTPGKGKYEMKSGIVEYKAKVMGMDAKQTLYFDDYGAKEANETDMEMMGVISKTISITRDGFIYNIDPEKKTGTKTSISPRSGNIDFENLTEAIQKEMNISKEGSENFMNKSCTKYSIDSKSLQMKGYYLVWKGIPLKTDVNMGSMKMLMDAKKINENAAIPAGKFDIPKDIVFN